MKDKFLSTIKVGPKGQIVIPKEAREILGIEPGDTVLLLADKERGLAIVNYDDYKDFAEGILRKSSAAGDSDNDKGD